MRSTPRERAALPTDHVERRKLLQWFEDKLANENIPDELPEDMAVASMRRENEARGTVPEERILHALQDYWVNRGAVRPGDHLKAAQEIADNLGVPPVEIEDRMKEVEDSIGQVQAELAAIAREEGESGGSAIDIHEKISAEVEKRREEFDNIDHNVLPVMIGQAVSDYIRLR